MFSIKDSFEFNGDMLYTGYDNKTYGFVIVDLDSVIYYRVLSIEFKDTSLLRFNYVYDKGQNEYAQQTDSITALIVSALSTICDSVYGKLEVYVNGNYEGNINMNDGRNPYLIALDYGMDEIDSVRLSFENNCYVSLEENRDIFIFDIYLNTTSYIDSVEVNVDPVNVGVYAPGRNLFGIYLARDNDNIIIRK